MVSYAHAPQSEVELLQDAFFNFDEDKDFYLHLDELRHIVTADGEPMNDVRALPRTFRFTRLGRRVPR